MSLKSQKEQEKRDAITALLEFVKPGMRVRTILRHVSASGMTREISCVVVDPRDNEMFCIDYLVSCAIGYRIGRHGGIVCGGAGMDMGFHLVYTLGRTLWPNGTPKPHGKRNGQPDRDGGYALKHDWL